MMIEIFKNKPEKTKRSNRAIMFRNNLNGVIATLIKGQINFVKVFYDAVGEGEVDENNNLGMVPRDNIQKLQKGLKDLVEINKNESSKIKKANPPKPENEFIANCLLRIGLDIVYGSFATNMDEESVRSFYIRKIEKNETIRTIMAIEENEAIEKLAVFHKIGKEEIISEIIGAKEEYETIVKSAYVL